MTRDVSDFVEIRADFIPALGTAQKLVNMIDKLPAKQISPDQYEGLIEAADFIRDTLLAFIVQNETTPYDD